MSSCHCGGGEQEGKERSAESKRIEHFQLLLRNQVLYIYSNQICKRLRVSRRELRNLKATQKFDVRRHVHIQPNYWVIYFWKSFFWSNPIIQSLHGWWNLIAQEEQDTETWDEPKLIKTAPTTTTSTAFHALLVLLLYWDTSEKVCKATIFHSALTQKVAVCTKRPTNRAAQYQVEY